MTSKLKQVVDSAEAISNATGIPTEKVIGAALKQVNKNKEPDDDGAQGVAGKRLLSFIERVERLETERDALSQDIREVFSEAKAVGFEVKIMRKLLKLRRIDTQKRAEEQALLETYAAAIGMQYALPL